MTTTTTVSSLNPSNVGQQVTFTATVAPTSGTGTPTGTVTFDIDGTAQTPVPLQVVGGKDEAEFPISSLTAGSHTVAATYNGDSTFGSSTGELTPEQTVNLIGTDTTTVSSLNPSNVGQQVTFTATVAPASGTGTPSGTVTFTIDGTAETPVAAVKRRVCAGGGHRFPTSTLTAGSHTVSATYNGDSTFATSTGNLSPSRRLSTASQPALWSRPQENPSAFGDLVSFTATVAAALGGADTPTGTVTFIIDGHAQATVPLQTVQGQKQATFQISTLTAGSHGVDATYNGDSIFAPATEKA